MSTLYMFEIENIRVLVPSFSLSQAPYYTPTFFHTVICKYTLTRLFEIALMNVFLTG